MVVACQPLPASLSIDAATDRSDFREAAPTPRRLYVNPIAPD
jgi:hypothetical protein